jgi:hypothetical protein
VVPAGQARLCCSSGSLTETAGAGGPELSPSPLAGGAFRSFALSTVPNAAGETHTASAFERTIGVLVRSPPPSGPGALSPELAPLGQRLRVSRPWGKHLRDRDPAELGLDRRVGAAVDGGEVALDRLADLASRVDLVQAE